MRKSDKSNTFLNLGLTESVFFLSWSPVHTQSFFPYLAFHLTYCYHIVCLNHNHINKLTLNNALLKRELLFHYFQYVQEKERDTFYST